MTPKAHLNALGMNLRGFGYEVEFAATHLVVRNPARGCPDQSGESDEGAADTITCRPREDDGGRLWYFTSWNQPIAEADHYVVALTTIRAYLGPPQ
jgi:hypothetical protein